MTTSIQSPADIVNAALVRIGHPLRIGTLFDGSPAAKRSLDVYGQTRDEELRLSNWGFAERNVALTVLKTAPVGGYTPPTVWTPAYPPLPFIYEYAYPADCIRVRAVKSAPLFIPTFNPQPKLYRIANDNSLNPPAKVILCNVTNALLIYTGRVTDPTLWEPSFAEALIASLARRLTVALADPKLLQLEAQDEQTETTLADMRQG